MTELEKIKKDLHWIADHTALRHIEKLLTLTSIYEKELLQFVPVTYLDDIKKEVFK